MDLQLGIIIAAVGALSAGGATVIAWVGLSRSARKERADADKKFADEMHALELRFSGLSGAVKLLDTAHNHMQGELAREFEEISTAQRDEFKVLREVQQMIGDMGTRLAANTERLLSVKERLDRSHDRQVHGRGR